MGEHGCAFLECVSFCYSYNAIRALLKVEKLLCLASIFTCKEFMYCLHVETFYGFNEIKI